MQYKKNQLRGHLKIIFTCNNGFRMEIKYNILNIHDFLNLRFAEKIWPTSVLYLIVPSSEIPYLWIFRLSEVSFVTQRRQPDGRKSGEVSTFCSKVFHFDFHKFNYSILCITICTVSLNKYKLNNFDI